MTTETPADEEPKLCWRRDEVIYLRTALEEARNSDRNTRAGKRLARANFDTPGIAFEDGPSLADGEPRPMRRVLLTASAKSVPATIAFANGAPQRAAAASFAVIPYCLPRAPRELFFAAVFGIQFPDWVQHLHTVLIAALGMKKGLECARPGVTGSSSIVRTQDTEALGRIQTQFGRTWRQ